MADCKEQVYSNDFFDFIVPYGEVSNYKSEGDCIQRIDEDYDIFFYPREGLPPLKLGNYTYSSIPKCYGLLDRAGLEISGIIKMQMQPALALKGDGVLVGFIDTGIDYTNPLFQYADGSTRITRIWDQTIEDGIPPEGILYGAEYSSDKINEALQSETPYEIVPSRDEDGHGTFMAGVACGGEDIANNFIGAAPNAEIAMVKLKEAKQYLRDFFFIPDDIPAFQENDIMMAVSYLNQLATLRNKPLVICLALGNSNGTHGKDGHLSSYLNYICLRRERSVVSPTGNEAGTRHHFLGSLLEDMEYQDVEISVEQDMEGFFVELWADVPELYAVAVISPTGEVLPKIPVRIGASELVNFIFERTTVTIDYRIESRESGSQLIFFRFQEPKRGIWRIRVFPQGIVSGRYNMWLPMKQLTNGDIYFLRSNPDITLTSPSAAEQVITVGGYNSINQSIFADSGRGFTVSGAVKPDFVAPAVNISGPGLRKNYVAYSGTSASAAIAAGAVAQIWQWGIVERNEPMITNSGIKNMLIRGTDRPNVQTYPNPEWGYGTLNVYRAFEVLRQ